MVRRWRCGLAAFKVPLLFSIMDVGHVLVADVKIHEDLLARLFPAAVFTADIQEDGGDARRPVTFWAGSLLMFTR